MKTQTKSKKVNKAWLHDHVNDTYVKQAQKDGYRARAAYKLKEIDEAFGLVKPGQVVVDLGAAPGAWSQYLRRRLSPRGLAAVADPDGRAASEHSALIALDLLDVEPIEGVTFIQGDFQDDAVLNALETALNGRPVDLVVSDMAPNLSGIKSTDTARVEQLVELAIDFAAQHLKPQGVLVAKVFHGMGYESLVEQFRGTFRVVKAFKPAASRDRSAETYLVGLGLSKP